MKRVISGVNFDQINGQMDDTSHNVIVLKTTNMEI